MAPTTASPEDLTTIPEQWDMGNSKNHVILLQIEEWFHSALVGIRQAPGSAGYRDLVIDPRVVGDLTHAEGGRRIYTVSSGTYSFTVRNVPSTP